VLVETDRLISFNWKRIYSIGIFNNNVD